MGMGMIWGILNPVLPMDKDPISYIFLPFNI